MHVLRLTDGVDRRDMARAQCGNPGAHEEREKGERGRDAKRDGAYDHARLIGAKERGDSVAPRDQRPRSSREARARGPRGCPPPPMTIASTSTVRRSCRLLAPSEESRPNCRVRSATEMAKLFVDERHAGDDHDGGENGRDLVERVPDGRVRRGAHPADEARVDRGAAVDVAGPHVDDVVGELLRLGGVLCAEEVRRPRWRPSRRS